ncbi:tellurite resistance/C4-dicarboxylate transporter family protein [Streptomyces sp. NPDC005573]|uniref:tellurite resistance/C4-dicarboxylate transporter family protein n=1 Tax=Streptomyces sp. NPDC005573 TaxID=3156890 RepID=UPI0033B6DFA5
MSAIFRMRDWWARWPPAAGAAVMGTGMISIGLHLTGFAVLSGIALVLASLGWLVLAAGFGVRLVRERDRWLREAGMPAGLTAVAATATLGTRCSALGLQELAEALLALSVLWWPVLQCTVFLNRRPRMPGGVFLICVATQALSALAVSIAVTGHVMWLLYAALVLFWLGLAQYAVALSRFHLDELRQGAGDHWIAGGALGSSALAGARLVDVRHVAPYAWNDDDQNVLRRVSVVLIVLALALLCVLALAEVIRPRPGYDVRRWATVFPIAVTATGTLSVATALGLSGFRPLGEALLWLAVAVWVIVAAGTARAAARST